MGLEPQNPPQMRDRGLGADWASSRNAYTVAVYAASEGGSLGSSPSIGGPRSSSRILQTPDCHALKSRGGFVTAQA